jgi:hypothetical protein
MSLRPLGDQYCITCRWFENWEYENQVIRDSLCRRHPPVVLLDSGGLINSCFPSVEAHDWCGEWSSSGMTYLREPPQRGAKARPHNDP